MFRLNRTAESTLHSWYVAPVGLHLLFSVGVNPQPTQRTRRFIDDRCVYKRATVEVYGCNKELD